MAKRTLDIYSHTTFTVGRQEDDKKQYDSGKGMWDDLIWNRWQQASLLRKNGITGSAKEAQKIETLFNELYKAINDNAKIQELGLTTEEVFLINTIFSTVGLSNKIKGISFETAISELVEYLFKDSPFEDIEIGSEQVGSIKFNVGKMEIGAEKFYETILKDAKKRGRTAIKALVYKIEGEWKKGELRDVYARTAKRSGKIDIFAGGAESIVLESSSKKLQVLANLLKGHTFSLKNYNSTSIHIGNTSLWRVLPAFYYASTQDNNFSNLARFLFVNEADRKKKDQTVMSYQAAAKAIYELTGVGLETKGSSSFSSNKNKAVDYLMVLLPGPVMRVRSTKEIVKNIYNHRSSFSFYGDITI